MFDLTSFQRDLLYIAMGLERPSGQDIKTELEKQLDEVTRGRLYPNLDTLVEKDHLEKGSLDRRTNYYDLTEDGRQTLREHRQWQEQYIDFDTEPEPTLDR